MSQVASSSRLCKTTMGSGGNGLSSAVDMGGICLSKFLNLQLKVKVGKNMDYLWNCACLLSTWSYVIALAGSMHLKHASSSLLWENWSSVYGARTSRTQGLLSILPLENPQQCMWNILWCRDTIVTGTFTSGTTEAAVKVAFIMWSIWFDSTLQVITWGNSINAPYSFWTPRWQSVSQPFTIYKGGTMSCI